MARYPDSEAANTFNNHYERNLVAPTPPWALSMKNKDIAHDKGCQNECVISGDAELVSTNVYYILTGITVEDLS